MTGVSGQAERKIYFMNIGFHYEGEKNSFAVDHSLMTLKSICMNLLAVAACLICGGNMRKKERENGFPLGFDES